MERPVPSAGSEQSLRNEGDSSRCMKLLGAPSGLFQQQHLFRDGFHDLLVNFVDAEVAFD